MSANTHTCLRLLLYIYIYIYIYIYCSTPLLPYLKLLLLSMFICNFYSSKVLYLLISKNCKNRKTTVKSVGGSIHDLDNMGEPHDTEKTRNVNIFSIVVLEILIK